MVSYVFIIITTWIDGTLLRALGNQGVGGNFHLFEPKPSLSQVKNYTGILILYQFGDLPLMNFEEIVKNGQILLSSAKSIYLAE